MSSYAVQYVPTGGAQPRKYVFTVVDANRNPYYFHDTYQSYSDWAAAVVGVAAQTNNQITYWGPALTYFYLDNHTTDTAYDKFRNVWGFFAGINGGSNLSAFHVGDKFIINKGGSYLQITNLNTQYFTVDFQYKTASGAVAYDRVSVNCGGSSNSRHSYMTIPWLANFTTINNYTLKSFTFAANQDGTLGVYGEGNNFSPVSTALAQAFWEGTEPIDTDDPYMDIPDSEPSGPAEGTGIPESDPVDFPALPTFSVTDTGFITLFNPTMAQVKNLADYMWNGLFDVNTFKKIFADPMDCILGFNMVPVAVPSGSAANINIGNIVTSVTMNIATSQWVELDCGSIDIGLPYGSYLDYSPYTKFSIYLPYIGTFDLSTDDVAGNVLSLKYHVDVLSCSCVAYLKCGNHVLYQWTGACGYSIPVTQNDFSRMIMTIISIAAAGVGGAVTAGAAGAGMVGMLGGAAKGAGESAAKNVMGLKPDVHRSGAIGSGAGLMGGQTPYLIIEIPNACKPKKQYHYTGYPGFITTTVGALSGYAEFESVILDGIGCTEEERGIIENLLMGGVYV